MTPGSDDTSDPKAPQRRNGQGDHHGVGHSPEEFDPMNPAKIAPPGPQAKTGKPDSRS